MAASATVPARDEIPTHALLRRSFALATRDYAEKEAGGDPIALPLERPAFVSLDAVWRANLTGEVKQVLEILLEVTRSRRPT